MRAALVQAGLVGSGGFIGAVLRYGLTWWEQRRLPVEMFPYGTLAVNLAGCLLIGAFVGVAESRPGFFGADVRLFSVVGLLGGFTTYSAFGFESFDLLRPAICRRRLRTSPCMLFSAWWRYGSATRC